MSPAMQEAAIIAAQDAIANFTTEQGNISFYTYIHTYNDMLIIIIIILIDIANAIKQKFEVQFPSTWHCFIGRNFGCFVTHEVLLSYLSWLPSLLVLPPSFLISLLILG